MVIDAHGVRIITPGESFKDYIRDYTVKREEPIPQLLAIAEYITKTLAICMKWCPAANWSRRIFESDERVAVGVCSICEAVLITVDCVVGASLRGRPELR